MIMLFMCIIVSEPLIKISPVYVGITETQGEIRLPHSSGFYVDLAGDRMSSGKHRQSSRPSGLIILVPVYIPSLALKEPEAALG